MKALIVTGGFVDDKFTLEYVNKEKYDVCVAVDRGLGFFHRMGLKPDYIVGDFDSVESSMLETYAAEGCGKDALPEEGAPEQKSVIVRLNPVKDDTDTEHALQMVLDLGCQCIHIFGGTGTRLDHVLGNLQLLGYALRRQAECMMIDPYNRIRLVDGETVLKKDSQFGAYVSLIPYTPQVRGLTLEGFKYPLNRHTMSSFYLEGAATVSGVSNEIVEEQARISFDEGILVLVEARDAS